MKDKKTIILMILAVILVICIIFVTILFLGHKKDTNEKNDEKNEFYDTWYIYKQDLIRDDQIINTSLTDAYYLIIGSEKISVCAVENEYLNCDYVDYVYKDNHLSISEDNKYLTGNYKLSIDNGIMILEKTENEKPQIVIKNYFKKQRKNIRISNSSRPYIFSKR